MTRTTQFAAAFVVVLALASVPAAGQVGSGLLDLNSAPEAQLSGLPLRHLVPDPVIELIGERGLYR